MKTPLETAGREGCSWLPLWVRLCRSKRRALLVGQRLGALLVLIALAGCGGADGLGGVDAYQNGTATPLQRHILRQGHVEVP